MKNERQIRVVGIAAGTWLVALGFLVLTYVWMMHMFIVGVNLHGKIILRVLFMLPLLSVLGGFFLMKRGRAAV